MGTPNGPTAQVTGYKLRSGGAVPMSNGKFLAQAFGVDANDIITYEGSTQLPESDDFTGATINGQYISASFNRLPYLNSNRQQLFQGTMTKKTEFEDESTVGWL